MITSAMPSLSSMSIAIAFPRFLYCRALPARVRSANAPREASRASLCLVDDALDEFGAARPVVDHAGHRAARQVAVHRVAVLMAVLANIGALAAISICERVSRSCFRIANAERSSSAIERRSAFGIARPLRSAQDELAQALLDSSR